MTRQEQLLPYFPEIMLLVVGMMARVAFALLPLDIHFMLLEDDAWMVTTIARHWAMGHGITADGIYPTNGFHPLYPLTVGALPYVVAPNSMHGGFQANLVLCALLNSAALIPCYGLLRLVATRHVALAGLAVIAINPFFISVSVNAMETSLALLLLLALWWYVLARQPNTVGEGAIAGLLAGLAILARLDNGIAVALVGVVLLWREMTLHKALVSGGDYGYGIGAIMQWVPRTTLAFGATASLVLLPYIARNIIVFGAVLPSSGRALAYMHSFRESFAFSSGLQLIAYQPALDLTWAPAWLLMVGIIALAVMVWQLSPAQRADIVPLLGYALALTFYYSYVQQQGRPRYYSAVAVVMVMVMCGLLSRWALALRPRLFARIAPTSRDDFSDTRIPTELDSHRWSAATRAWELRERPITDPENQDAGLFSTLKHMQPSVRVYAAYGVALVIIISNVFLFVQHVHTLATAPYLAQPAMYNAARWIAENIPADARLAAQNSGVFQYYSERVVINIDGKLNNDMIPVLETRTLDSYLREKGIRYIVDLHGVTDYIIFYSSTLSDAPTHHEVSLVHKLAIYMQMMGAKVGINAPIELDERVPTHIKRSFDSVSNIRQSFPLPNDPTHAVVIYELTPDFGT